MMESDEKNIQQDLPAEQEQDIAENALPEEQLLHSAEVEQIEMVIEPVENFLEFSKEELVAAIENILTEPDNNISKSRIFSLREAFNDLVNHERQQQLEKYLEEGGEKKDFIYKADELEIKFFDALKKINRRRTEFLENQEKQRDENLKIKKEILFHLKEIIQNEENMQKAFNKFHELQEQWRTTGPVPQKDVHDLWMTYKLYIEKFYDLIKINRELQDLDQRKNLEMKLRVCEQMEELLLEPSINKALSKLSVFQNTWREIGTVPRDKRTEIGERFKTASSKIIERKKEFLDQQKIRLAESLNLKTALCEKAEQVTVEENISHHELQEKLKLINEMQLEWRKSGYAEKTIGGELWKRFKNACDNFFSLKNEYYSKKKKEYQSNFQAKTELCMQAEAMANSTDWKNSSVELKRLHEQWKKIGPVGYKFSDKIWNRFKKATDAFYNHRKVHFAGIEKEHKENLMMKQQLIEKIKQFQPGESKNENLGVIRQFQHAWSEIGLVPFAEKENIYQQYKKAVDVLFDSLRISDKEKSEIRFKEKIDHLKSSPQGKEKISDEKHGLINKISHLNNEVNTWENNLGFFAKSKNAAQIKKEFEAKINKAKDEITKLKEQLQLIKNI